ncbi:tripartite tricarboxylate transporter substrate binding protein [uncultured Hydrogenophaga sp.]|uniref:Bug family tripartite tricarboxylate transporter substrate binding protein n=1 Tax=uncultured Hydrogenophaga sp. TaxID=199683 RepID=UPI00258BE7C1|nr:tripartite tricarboxylate transporter substrate binding protein [uncultured Hydrogenophaga sp.]
MTRHTTARRRVLLASATLMAASALLPATAFAQDYPNRPIRVIVPFAPGGVVDTTARLLTQKLTERLGWNFVVENKPGGNGFIAVTTAAKAPADGYTLLAAHTGEFAVNPALFPNVPYELDRDFTPITMISDTPMLLVANAQQPFNTVPELVAAAKKAPGSITFSSPGNGSINHLAGEWFAMEAGTKLLHVPYRGGAPAAAAVASGEVALGVVAIPAVIPHMQSGRVKVLGLTTARRSSFNKEWVTANEAGVKNVDASNWVGLFAPKGVPADVVARLYAEVVKTLEQPDVKKRFADAGAELGGMSSADFGQRIRSDATRFKDIVQKANIRPE